MNVLSRFAIINACMSGDKPYNYTISTKHIKQKKNPKKEYARIEPYQHRSTKLTKRKKEALKQ